jgi:DNA-binding NarL/FixJ family response regulator
VCGGTGRLFSGAPIGADVDVSQKAAIATPIVTPSFDTDHEKCMSELPLTSREKKLLRRLAKGWSVDLIAQSIGGTKVQVRDQRDRLLAKLGIDSHEQLIEAAARLAPWPPAKR